MACCCCVCVQLGKANKPFRGLTKHITTWFEWQRMSFYAPCCILFTYQQIFEIIAAGFRHLCALHSTVSLLFLALADKTMYLTVFLVASTLFCIITMQMPILFIDTFQR